MADTKNPSLADRLRDALAAVPAGAAGRGPSELREQVRAVFDRLTADRKRGATWDGLAAAFAALGVTTAAGRPPTGADLRNAYHAERYARGGKRKRRPKHGPAAQETPSGAARAEAPAPASAAPAATATATAPSPAAEGLRAALAKRRPDLREPPPVTLGPGDRRRPGKEADDDG